ncbi:PhzF family phenazine biosynthesis protein [Sphingomonas soli]|uniref:PhzF family phenazine biosynthesis protein n=1 Tax=Sphingomonas soli TaxID=266127 RepID=UPI00082E2666|nr:PhzF family phenazine biosynthesis protein [Sphingomonas soli]
MRDYQYFTVDVFTDKRFGGNPLAVFPDAAGLDAATMQALAAELNYSETTFVLPPRDPANTAQVRIFNRTSEMPFAGHPNVGTAFVLAQLGRASGNVLRFEEISGLIAVRLGENGGAADIDAPQPLTIKESLPTKGIASCLSLGSESIVATSHAPLRASVGVDFVLAEVAGEALSRAAPDLGAYHRLAAQFPQLEGRLSIFLYASEGADVRARMFAPLAGTWEDPATGSANATLAALRLQLSGAGELAYRAVQGVEMGRPSHLSVRAWRSADGVRAGVGGNCVSVFRGSISL